MHVTPPQLQRGGRSPVIGPVGRVSRCRRTHTEGPPDPENGSHPVAAHVPLRAAPAYVQRRASGSVQVFPLAIPDGHSLALPLGPLGEVALGNEAGHLAVSVPAHLRSAVEPHLRDVMVRGPEVRSAGQAWVATFTVRVIPGTRRVLPRARSVSRSRSVAARLQRFDRFELLPDPVSRRDTTGLPPEV